MSKSDHNIQNNQNNKVEKKPKSQKTKLIIFGIILSLMMGSFIKALKNFRIDAHEANIPVRPLEDLKWILLSCIIHIVIFSLIKIFRFGGKAAKPP